MLRTALFLIALFLGAAWIVGAGADEDDGRVSLDYEFYKAEVAPVLERRCAECHAEPRERRKLGRHVLRPAPGRRVRESHHRRNFETISRLIEPGNPAASVYLLKPLDPRQGGLTHKGGTRLDINTPDYGTLVDWINGATLPDVVWTPPPPVAGQPDFRFFVARISPVIQGECAECHQGKGFGKFKIKVPVPDEPFTFEDRFENFQTVLQLIEPGKPDRSKFLRKPLPRSAGGLKHRGGDRFEPGDADHEAWRAFISGEAGPQLPTGEPPPTPRLTTRGLTLQAEAFAIGAELSETDQVGAAGTVIEAVDGDGDMYVDIDVADPGVYRLLCRITAGGPALRWSLDQAPMALAAPARAADADEHGFAVVGPLTLADGERPLTVVGDVRLANDVLELDAQGIRASVVSPEVQTHDGAAVRFSLPDDSEGGDDALLLFDAIDGQNGKVCGLTDGGRRMVIGVLEGGRLRILDSAPARPREGKAAHDIRVRYFSGVAVGELDDRPHVRMHLGKALTGEGRVGFLTHGVASVSRLVLLEQFELYRVAPRYAPVVYLPPGRHRLWIELPRGGGLLDQVRLEPTDAE